MQPSAINKCTLTRGINAPACLLLLQDHGYTQSFHDEGHRPVCAWLRWHWPKEQGETAFYLACLRSRLQGTGAEKSSVDAVVATKRSSTRIKPSLYSSPHATGCCHAAESHARYSCAFSKLPSIAGSLPDQKNPEAERAQRHSLSVTESTCITAGLLTFKSRDRRARER